jgi:hypothetical protein
VNQIPYSLPSSFFWLPFFFGVHFHGQTKGTDLHHTVSMVGVTDPGISGAWLGWGSYLSEFICKYIHVHLQKKHTSEHPLPYLRSDLKSSANFGLDHTFKIFKKIKKYIPASGVYQGHSTCIFVPCSRFLHTCQLNPVRPYQLYRYSLSSINDTQGHKNFSFCEQTLHNGLIHYSSTHWLLKTLRR